MSAEHNPTEYRTYFLVALSRIHQRCKEADPDAVCHPIDAKDVQDESFIGGGRAHVQDAVRYLLDRGYIEVVPSVQAERIVITITSLGLEEAQRVGIPPIIKRD